MFPQSLNGPRVVGCLFVAFFLALLNSASAFGEDAAGSRFHEAIRRIAEARSRITSYDVTITGKVAGAPERELLTNGKMLEIEEVLIGFTLKTVFDKEQSKRLVARQNTRRLKSTGKVVTAEWQVFGRTLEDIKEGDKWRSDTGRFYGVSTEFFDPLGLGLCFEGEFRRGDPWRVSVANYLKWSDHFRREDLADGKVRFEDLEYSIIIDTKHDQWPTKMTLMQNRELSMETKVAVAKVHGHWLPADAIVTLRDGGRTDLRFEWHSVNQAIPEERFRPAGIKLWLGPPPVAHHRAAKEHVSSTSSPPLRDSVVTSLPQTASGR